MNNSGSQTEELRKQLRKFRIQEILQMKEMDREAYQLREWLLQGLDKDYNVVDFDIVEAIISQLEIYPITKEALETTLLGKHINLLQKKLKASDIGLASRAESLVKKWRDLLEADNDNSGTTIQEMEPHLEFHETFHFLAVDDQKAADQIRDRLLQGLDKDYNVVDMDIVAEVISRLEIYSITKKALVATRLGKHINELRRKTNDKDLASRAKNLVQKWQDLLKADNGNSGTTTPISTVGQVKDVKSSTQIKATKRKFQEMEAHQEFHETLQQLVDDLVCQLCRGYPKPEDLRWYKCSDQHHICQSCIESKEMEKCSCQANIVKKVDKTTETLLKMKNLKFKCRHCSDFFLREDINVHESGCHHRLVPCLFADYDGPYKCEEKFRFDEILELFQSMHHPLKIHIARNGVTYFSKISNYSKATLIQLKIRFIPKKIEVFGKCFIATACERNGVFYEWIRLLGSPSEAKNYKFSLEYKGPERTHVFMGNVASIDEKLDSIITSGKCSSIGFETFVHQFIVETPSGQRITSTITIKKREDS